MLLLLLPVPLGRELDDAREGYLCPDAYRRREIIVLPTPSCSTGLWVQSILILIFFQKAFHNVQEGLFDLGSMFYVQMSYLLCHFSKLR